MNPLKYLIVPLGCLLALGFLLTSRYGEQWSWLVILPIILLVPVYVFGAQIKWWYWQRYAPDLPSMAAPVLDFFPFYKGLGLLEKREFRRRTFLIQEAANFIGKGEGRIPEDVRLMIAASAAVVSFHKTPFLPEDFDTIVLYQHDFPSPQYEALHATEVFVPEGTLIFNIQKLVRSVVEPQQYLHLGFFTYARVYRQLYPQQLFPALTWPQITSISRFPEAALMAYLGLPDVQTSELGMVLYFTHSAAFQQQAPDLYKAYATLLTAQH